MNDLISRQAAIDALGEKPLVWDDLSDFDLGKAAQWSDDVDAIKELPSAQPQHEVRFSDADHVWIDGKQYISLQRFGEAVKDAQPKHTEERTETHACDLIDRDAAIDFIDAGHLCNPNEPRWSDNEVVNFLKSRPSAQPEKTQLSGESTTKDSTFDCISRQAAIAFVDCGYLRPPTELAWSDKDVVDMLKRIPSAQPEIIRCRECKFASGDSRICMKFGHSPIGELDFCAWAERRTDE